MSKTTTAVPSGSGRKTPEQGRVKWFNSQAGYGFIETTDTEGIKTDLFVHHSALSVGDDMFRFLVEGEYVEYVTKQIMKDGCTKWTATNVTGIGGGPLQCETRHNRRVTESKRSGPQKSRPSSPQSDRLWQVVKDQLSGS